MALDPGFVAFMGYKQFTDNKTHDNREIPEWTELGEQIRGAWRAAADAVLMYKSTRDSQALEDIPSGKPLRSNENPS